MMYIINCESFIYFHADGAEIYKIYFQIYNINRITR